MNLAEGRSFALPLICKRIIFYFLILTALCVLVLLAVWPWPLYFLHGFARHWDPPLHIWKLSWNIKHILGGKVFLPEYNANSFYPHAYTFCFHDLYWIPSWFAAIVYKIYPNIIFVYNITFLAMWVFSGLCMYWLLKEFALSELAAFFGAVAFCLVPYRTSYYMEFNMQLCFGVPLVILFMVRFIKNPTLMNSLGLAISFWAQAVSALYYAVIIACSLPFLLLPWWKEIVNRLKEKGFYIYLFVVLVVGCGLGALYLWPYVVLKHTSHLYRLLSEINRHSAQPLSYFLTRHHASIFFGHVPAEPPENVIFPGFTLLLLAAYFLWRRRRNVGIEKGIFAHRVWSWIRMSSLFAFFAICFIYACQKGNSHVNVSLVINIILCILLLSSVLLSVTWEGLDDRDRFIEGLASASVIAFILSMGPLIKTCYHGFLGFNEIYLFLYKYSYIMKGLRVLSRFSIIIIVFIIILSSFAIHDLTSGKGWQRLLVIPVIGLIFWESHVVKYRYWVQPSNLLSPKISKVLDDHHLHSIIVIPIGNRNDDGRYMMSVADSKYLLVNGWDAFYPRYAREMARLFSDGDLNRAVTLLRRLWPSPYILVDRERLSYLKTRGYGTSEENLKKVCDFVIKDDRFTLYAIKKKTDFKNRYIRYIRLDFVKNAKAVIFKVRLHDQNNKMKKILVELNNHPFKIVLVSNVWKEFCININHKIPLRLDKNLIILKPFGYKTVNLQVSGFRLIPKKGFGAFYWVKDKTKG